VILPSLAPASRAALLAALALTALAPACKEDEPATTLGVNDVRKACELRRSWTALDKDTCKNCRAAAPLADCGCEAFKDYAAKCVPPQDAVKSEASCTDQIQICVKTCQVTDCDCIDACYANAGACRRVSGGLDGCVADVCAPYCN
jgi:hypothetical protein